MYVFGVWVFLSELIYLKFCQTYLTGSAGKCMLHFPHLPSPPFNVSCKAFLNEKAASLGSVISKNVSQSHDRGLTAHKLSASDGTRGVSRRHVVQLVE